MCPRNAKLGGADACERHHRGLQWSSAWGYEALHWVERTQANVATGAFGGAPYVATKRCITWDECRRRTFRWSSIQGHGTVHWARQTHANVATGAV
eukprot:2489437-Pyramimonas_sp.AAC.1